MSTWGCRSSRKCEPVSDRQTMPWLRFVTALRGPERCRMNWLTRSCPMAGFESILRHPNQSEVHDVISAKMPLEPHKPKLMHGATARTTTSTRNPCISDPKRLMDPGGSALPGTWPLSLRPAAQHSFPPIPTGWATSDFQHQVHWPDHCCQCRG
jgi:hypothetical protein